MARGRPRKYSEGEALDSAMLLFWQKGYAATSLDDLSIAMNMNRPSIYNAFGNKDAIYRKSLARFRQGLEQAVTETLVDSKEIKTGLEAFFYQAISVYSGGEPALGCLIICTAPSEAISHEDVGADLKELIGWLDSAFASRLQLAKNKHELAGNLDVELTAKLLQATLHTLALRARSGATVPGLRKLARYSIATLLSR